MVDEDFASVVERNLAPGATPCSLCSRLRRGVLYNLAVELGCAKIALGHHADDLIETLVLNLFFSGRLAAMPAVLRSDDGRNTVIRPLAYVPEAMLVDYAEAMAFPTVRCGCPSCGLPDQKRQVVKRMLGALEDDHPGIKSQARRRSLERRPITRTTRARRGRARRGRRRAARAGRWTAGASSRGTATGCRRPARARRPC
jgi:tRNA 2-thiocytidine biosynthesis protein TtcA